MFALLDGDKQVIEFYKVLKEAQIAKKNELQAQIDLGLPKEKITIIEYKEVK